MNALRSTVKLAARSATQRVQKRQMGSGAAPQWTGIDKVIRDRFPEDYQGRLFLRWSCVRCTVGLLDVQLLQGTKLPCTNCVDKGLKCYDVWT